MDVLLYCCCGLDVHRDRVEACIQRGIDGEPEGILYTFGTRKAELQNLTKWLEEYDCFTVAMESTGVYWIPVYEALETGRQGTVLCLDKMPLPIVTCNGEGMSCAGSSQRAERKRDQKQRDREPSPVLEYFSSADRLCSWAGVVPRNDESAGKIKSRKTMHGNRFVKAILCQAAWAAVRTRHSPFHDWFWSHRPKLGQQKAIIAVARKLLKLIYHLLNTRQRYRPPLVATV